MPGTRSALVSLQALESIFEPACPDISQFGLCYVIVWAIIHICKCKWQYFLNISSHFAQLQLIECVDMSGQAFASAPNTWKHKVDSELFRDVAADVRGQQRLGCGANLSQTKINRAMAGYSALLVRLSFCLSI